MYCLYAVQSEKRSENGNLDSERLSWKTALVLAASENTYGDTGVFCAISRAKNIYACGMELDKYITKIKAGKMYKYMQIRELFSRGEKHEKQKTNAYRNHTGRKPQMGDRKSTRLNSSHRSLSRMPSSA